MTLKDVRMAKYFRFWIFSEIHRRSVNEAFHSPEAFIRKVLDAYGVLSQLQFCYPFIQWAAFGGNSIRENNRREQRKIIRYNHLVANLIIFHNVATMTRVLSELAAEGYPVNEEILSRLSPYGREHINRFGSYKLHLDQIPEPIVQELELGATDA